VSTEIGNPVSNHLSDYKYLFIQHPTHPGDYMFCKILNNIDVKPLDNSGTDISTDDNILPYINICRMWGVEDHIIDSKWVKLYKSEGTLFQEHPEVMKL